MAKEVDSRVEFQRQEGLKALAIRHKKRVLEGVEFLVRPIKSGELTLLNKEK